jgi:hypothetical protein
MSDEEKVIGRLIHTSITIKTKELFMFNRLEKDYF